MSCGPLVRQMMVLFNVLVSLGGLLLLAVGFWVSVGGTSFLHLLGPFSTQIQLFINVGFFCVSVGVILVLVGLLGSCGARKESKCLLISLSSVLLIIFMAEAAAGLVVFSYASFAEEILEAWATQALQNDYGRDPEVTQIWNSTMTEFSCCGFFGYGDFFGSWFQDETQGELPPSCCWTHIAHCRPEEAELSPVQGCSGPVLKLLRDQSHVVGGVAAGVAALEVAGVMLCVYLYTHLDKEQPKTPLEEN
ncbi:tetraspanin-1 [Nematolebias whitei]|uniref:tetraspanin-1 n=1 Tax=Nematolebias whitei TaxID=451745 RepID=UPI00189B0CA6|nr:tetraspanin-1 [Nematolebias whitei]